MSAEVFEEVAYVADCEGCGYKSELFETKREAERDAEKHDETCPGGEPHDGLTDRERYQLLLDDLAARGGRR